jgi:all-trans-retinol 13,14-reductase
MLTSPPWGRTLPDGPWDAIVIGSGVGGLATAATLAQIGRRVLVLERHLRPGGFTQTFRRGAARWDVGVHVVGEVGPADLPGRLLERLTGGALKWASIGPIIDRVVDEGGILAELPAGIEPMALALDRVSPGARRSAARYLMDTQEISRSLGRMLFARAVPGLERAFAAGPGASLVTAAIRTPARQGLEALPEALRPIMGLRWGYFGTPLDELSFAGLASATAHYIGGGYYPVGGAGQIAETLARTIQAAGGAVVVGCGVQRVSVENGRAVGVVVDQGELRADVVVSAIGAPGTLGLIVPPAEWAAEVRRLPLSMTHVALYLSLSEDPRTWGMDGANIWGVDPGSREVGWYASFPSLRDPAWKGPHLASIIRLVPWEARFEHRDESYEAAKAAIGEELLEQVGRVLPRLRGAIQHMEIATPSTVRRYIDAPQGATYGLGATRARFTTQALPAATPVPGLYLSGSDVLLPGVVGALLGGVACAVAIGGHPALRILLDAGRMRGG